MSATFAILRGDPARDELALARIDAERRVASLTGSMLIAIDGGTSLTRLRRQWRELREALADLGIIRHLERALDARDRGEVTT